MIYMLVIVAICIGCLMPVQAGINAELSKYLSNPYLGALISFAIGTLVLIVLTLTHGQFFQLMKKLTTASPHMYLGGVLGALFVGSSIFLIPKIGATTMIGAFVTGQLIGSVIMDHYGLFNLPVVPVSPVRITGVILLFCGLLMVVKKNA